MIYPNFLKEHDTIGVTAPSAGAENEIDLIRLENAKQNFLQKNINIIETPNCRTNLIGRSSTPSIRARELESLILSDKINSIICLSGGDFLLEMLPYLDYNIIAKNPKWIQGFSDPTGLLFTITTNLDIATIYSTNFTSFGMKPWHKSLYDNIEILKGNIITQHSFDLYEEERFERVTGEEGYNLTTPIVWRSLNNKKNINMEGRLIGGCLDILACIVGTKFDKTKEFIEKYKNDGIIWYFDNCELTNEAVIRTFWQMKQAGWLEYTKGIILGRSGIDVSCYNVSFIEAIKTSLSYLNVPIILDADVSHKSPRMTFINGAIATINLNNGIGTVEFKLQ